MDTATALTLARFSAICLENKSLRLCPSLGDLTEAGQTGRSLGAAEAVGSERGGGAVLTSMQTLLCPTVTVTILPPRQAQGEGLCPPPRRPCLCSPTSPPGCLAV